MITTVTLNPMLDRTIYLPQFEKGKIWRSKKYENAAGGKGINVSLQLKALGVENTATGFLGGEIGKIIKNIIDVEKVKNDFVFIENPTRIGFTILEETSLIQTSVFEPSPEIKPDERLNLLEKCIEYGKISEWMVLSGSVGDINLSNFYENAIKKIREVNPEIKIVLDSYGKEFQLGIKEKPFIVKPNKSEYENGFGVKINSESDFISAIKNLRNCGICLPIITNSEKEIYFSYENSIYKSKPPKINLINPIGSGDCMIAGILYGFLNFNDIEDIMKFGIAASAANASVWEIAKCNKNYIEKFMKEIEVICLS
jgi:tagatose 6-phosphate kinase